jgi:hypothetical protein
MYGGARWIRSKQRKEMPYELTEDCVGQVNRAMTLRYTSGYLVARSQISLISDHRSLKTLRAIPEMTQIFFERK